MNPINLTADLFAKDSQVPKRSFRQSEFGQLISAAVVSSAFRALLLLNPAEALDEGYNNQLFFFTPEEKQEIGTINATSLKDFAARLLKIEKTLEFVPSAQGTPVIYSEA